jgi:hypothetical protein
MANELKTAGLVASAYHYVQIRTPAGLLWRNDGGAAETYNPANWTKYVAGMAQTDARGFYVASFPTVIVTPGMYIILGPFQLGTGSTANDALESDFEAGDEDGNDFAWSGTEEITAVTLNIEASDPTLVNTGTAQSGGSKSITLAAGASAVTNFYVGQPIQLASGSGVGQVRTIIAYNGTTKVATLDRAWATLPDNTTVYKTRALVSSKLNDSLQVGAFTTSAASSTSSGGTTNSRTANYSATTHYFWTETFTLTGVDSTDWTAFVWTLKTSSAAADAAALLTLKVEDPADGASDGLTVLNAAITDGTSRPYGTLTIDDTGGNTVITWAIEAQALSQIAPSDSGSPYYWEVGRFKAGSPRKEIMCGGRVALSKALYLSTAAP